MDNPQFSTLLLDTKDWTGVTRKRLLVKASSEPFSDQFNKLGLDGGRNGNCFLHEGLLE
jgi:hypothetical protein